MMVLVQPTNGLLTTIVHTISQAKLSSFLFVFDVLIFGNIGNLYFGAIGYADDVSFISPSTYALHEMCHIALSFANEIDIKLYPLKLQLLYYGKLVTKLICPIYLIIPGYCHKNKVNILGILLDLM